MRTLIAFGMLLASLNARSGTVVEVDRFNEDGERDSVVTIHVQDGKLRVDQIDEEQQRSALIYDGDRVIDVIVSARSYAIIERAQLTKAKQTLDPQATLRQQLLAEVPSQRRGDAMLALSKPPGWAPLDKSISIQPTSRGSRQADLPCRIYQVLVSEQLAFEYCMVKDAAREDLAAVTQAAHRASSLISDFFGLLGMPWMQDTMQLHWTHAYDIEGFPLKVVEYDDGALVSEFRVRSVRTESAAQEMFSIPKDFQRRAVLDFTAPPRDLESSEEDFTQSTQRTQR